MGPPDIHAIMLQQKEQKDQIQKLILQLEASRSGNSHLRKRLLTTFDTLDYVQSELDTERKRNDKLMSERKAWKARIQDAEATRDDMKEAVEILIRKVELCNRDLTSWPRAQMYLPEPAAHSTSSKHSLEPIYLPHTDTLVQTIASERAAHTAILQELDIAEAKIAILNAQVARRDAELELYNFQFEGIQSTSRSNSGTGTRDNGASKSVRLAMSSQEEASRALQVTAERNRALEKEIEALTERLEKARCRIDVGYSIPADIPQSRPTTTVAVQTAPRASSPEMKSDVTSRVKSQAALDFEHQITLFAQAVDKFTEERTLHAQALGTHETEKNISERRDGFKAEPETEIPIPFKQILVIEQECIRLTKLNETMKKELAELQEENNGLRAELRTKSLEDPPQHEFLPALGSVGSPPSPAVSGNEKDVEISQTPDYHPSVVLLSGEDDEEETEASFTFRFLPFETPPKSRTNNSSVEAQPSEDSPYDPFDTGNVPMRPNDSESHIQGSGTAGDMAGFAQSLSPTKVPLPPSPE